MKAPPPFLSPLRAAAFALAGITIAGAACAQASLQFTAVADATIDSAVPDANFGAFDDVFAINAGATGSQEAYIRFDLSAIPTNAKVLAATLTYEVSGVSALAPTLTFGQVEEAWVEKGLGAIRFANRPKVGRELQQHAPTVGRHRLVLGPAFLSAVRSWVRQPGSNGGLRLRVTEGAVSKVRFASVVSREGARNGRTAATLRVDFVSVAITTVSLRTGILGEDYLSRVEAETQGVAGLDWRVLDDLPAGLDSRVVGGVLEVFGRPARTFDGAIRFEARDPVSGASQVRALELHVIPAFGEVVVSEGTAVGGGVFDPAGGRPLVAASAVLANGIKDTVDVVGLTVLVAGSADNVRDLSSIEVFVDVDEDGEVDPQDIRVGGPDPFVTDDDFVTVEIDGLRLANAGTRQVLVVVTPRIDCPEGRDFSMVFANSGFQRGVMRGSNTPARFAVRTPGAGKTFVAGEQTRFDGDANGDGSVDCLDVQILARRFGSAANGGADPDGNGVIDTADVELVQDRVLQRPVVTALRFVTADPNAGAPARLVVFGFGFDPDEGGATIDGQVASILLRAARTMILRVQGAGTRRLRIRTGAALSREYGFSAR